ncbi:hypothetical protein A3B57_01230 [Microgenomates group bacterium RIFCSPLOWO2_01_FULL_47_10]|nr:MAG: hypothetical protein A3B57_01230 [Microgenomates group bacterium RIFCSPLOWO2_01_FULL_47_10]
MTPFRRKLIDYRNKLEPYIHRGVLIGFVIFGGASWYLYNLLTQTTDHLSQKTQVLTETNELLSSASAELTALKNLDQYLINKDLEATISAVEKTYKQTVSVYEDLLELRTKSDKTKEFDNLFAAILTALSKRDYVVAASDTKTLAGKIQAENERIAREFVMPANLTASNTPPGAGFQRQKVSLDIGEYMVSIISADLNSTRVVVDTASDNSCGNECPVMSVAAYAARSGAFAAINGSYFCPASYPSCAGKTNSFDTLLMNKNKVYFNSDNNVYSSVPAVIFSGSSARFVGASSEWGRDTGVDSVLANQPLMVSGGNVTFGGDGDPKKGSKGNRSFVGATGSTVYIGVVHNATVAEAARVLSAMGMQGALNLDSGGSTALWNSGYKVGPGRDIPNALLLVRK